MGYPALIRQRFRLPAILILCSLLPVVACGEHVSKDLVGKDEGYIVNKLGQPTSSAIIRLTNSSRLYEYQYNLYKIFPQVGDKVIEIKELVWKRRGMTTVVWLKKGGNGWVVVDVLEWGPEIHY